jgi:Ca2+-transporting ATPase
MIARGLWQGSGLLALLLAVYAGVRTFSQSDDLARALTFVALVLSNLGLIQANRSWGRPFWRDSASSNWHFGWIAAGTVGVLTAVLGVPAISRLFFFETPPFLLLLGVLGVAMLSMLWFEGVKWGLGWRLPTASINTNTSGDS